MATVAILLSRLRKNDENNIGVVTLVASDPLYSRLLAAWGAVKRKLRSDRHPFEELPPGLPEDAHERWLWARVEPDPLPLWIAASGLPDAPHVRRAMQVLIENCAVFPDGKASMWVEKFLTEQARRAGVKLASEEDGEY
jgi:hypothetical protein